MCARPCRVRADLPADLRDPIVQKMDLAGQPVLAYTMILPPKAQLPMVPRHGRRSPELVRGQHALARKLLAVRGVGAVNRVGGVTREVRVALDAQKLQALGTTAADISRQLAPGADRKRRWAHRPGRQASNPCARWPPWAPHSEVAALEIVPADGRHIRLDQWPP
jgi:hypothetical protein